MYKNDIETFIQKWLDFDIQLREKKGLNEALYEEMIQLLQAIKAQLDEQDAIPKNLAEIFIDMYGAITSSADLYTKDECSDIYEAASRLCDHAREICIH